MTHSDDWSWFDAPKTNDVDLDSHDVTAVLVCRNAEDWLNATLAGLGQLDRRPDTLIAVDNGSDDDTRELLQAAADAGMIDRIVDGAATWSFGDAVTHAIEGIDPTRWLWFLHDDAIPDREALTHLLLLGARTPRLAMAVPLLVRPTRRNRAARTLEIGATISGSGRRELALEPDEVAQGQYESTSVLGGSTCGLLVKWESFDEIGGFDPAIASYRDGVDLGWRAQLVGQWAVTCPSARFIHRQAGRSEIRPRTIAARAHRSEAAWDRLMGLRLVQAHAHGLWRIVSWLRLIVVGLLRAVGFLLGKAPDRAVDEVQALGDFVFRSWGRVRRLRRKINRISQGKDTRLRVRSLRPTAGATVVAGFQTVGHWIRDMFGGSSDSAMTLEDLMGDEYTRRLGDTKRRTPVSVWIGIVIVAVAIMARGLYRSGIVTAPQLLGAPASLRAAFHLALVPGATTGAPEPWILLGALTSVICILPNWCVVVALILSYPVMMLVAAWFARYRVVSARVRWLAAAGYALIPIAMGGLNRGALWLVVLGVLLPFAAEWVQRCDMYWSGARSIQTMAGLALAGIMLFAVLPVGWFILVIVAIVRAVRGGTIGAIIRTVVAVLVPLAVWAWWLPSLWRTPTRLFTTPDPLLGATPQTWQMLFGRPVAGGLPPLWVSLVVFAAIWGGAVIAGLRDSRVRWTVVAGGAAVAIALWISHVDLPLYGQMVTPDPSPWLFAGFALLLLAGVRWIDDAMDRVGGVDFGAGQALLGLMSFVLTGCLLVGAGWAVWAGMSGVTRGFTASFPQYLAQTEVQRGTATLLIDAPAGTWNVRSGGQTLWGQGMAPADALASTSARDAAEVIVAGVLAGQSCDQAAATLAMMGISTVAVLAPSQSTITALDTTTSLQRTTAEGALQIWNNTISDPVPPTGRSLVGGDGQVKYLLPADVVTAGSGTLVLALPPDAQRTVLVGGTPLTPTTSPDWRAAYTVGGASGQVTLVEHTPVPWWVWVQLGVLLLLIASLLPPIGDTGGSSSGPRRDLGGVAQ